MRERSEWEIIHASSAAAGTRSLAGLWVFLWTPSQGTNGHQTAKSNASVASNADSLDSAYSNYTLLGGLQYGSLVRLRETPKGKLQTSLKN